MYVHVSPFYSKLLSSPHFIGEETEAQNVVRIPQLRSDYGSPMEMGAHRLW